ncbi:hypothetical protein SAMN05216570_1022 [Dyella sp. OK004]|uniref:hypothetical protein n=1 Tax=Dyella sp. OK004 TaxID=1855292 RepID=UPI0008E3057A|nr:hypothetical protein [Dyella sp. OK004]SFR94638.1 hypothetical protein SAMN05216570_1022 [Dyella sp. OK004]
MSLSLQELIDTIEPPPATSPEAAADRLYMQREYRAAAAAYRALEDNGARIQEKLGASLEDTGDHLAARHIFRPIEDDLSPIGKAIYAQTLFASVSSWGGREGYDAEPEEGIRVLESVLNFDVPPHFAFVVAARNRYHWKGDGGRASIGDQIIRGAHLYPRSELLLLDADCIRQSAQVDPAESIQPLLRFSIDVGVTPRLLWTIHWRYRQLQRPEEALSSLTEAIDCQRRQNGTRDTLGVLLAQRAQMHLQAESYAEAIADAGDAGALCTSHDERMASALIACLAALKADQRAAADEAAAAFLDALFAENQLPWFTAAELHGRMGGENWSGFEIVHFDLTMTAFAGKLERLGDPMHAGWFRYLIACEVMDDATGEGDNVEHDWAALGRILGNAAQLTQHHPHVEALDVRVRGELPDADWGELGCRWMSAWIAINAADGNTPDPTDLPSHLYAHAHQRDLFFAGIAKALKASSPGPHAFNALEAAEIVSYLVDKKMARILYDMLASICIDDDRTDPLFFLGWSAQTVNLRSEAFRAYFDLLDQEPNTVVAITNALLMCDHESMSGQLDQVRQRVATFKAAVDDRERYTKVDEAFEAARRRCLSKRSRLTETLTEAMRGYAQFGDRSATLKNLSLLDAITLVALLRTAPPAGDQLFLPRVSKGSIPFARLMQHRHGFFGLMQHGLISPGQTTDSASIQRKESGSYAWDFPEIDWHINPHALSLADEMRAIPHGGLWPKHWAGAARLLAVDFAREEIAAYLDEQAAARYWPKPDRDDRFQQLLALLVERVSVAEAYSLIYMGAMSAADNKTKYPTSATQASNLMVKRTGERLDRVMSGDLTPKVYDRSWNTPRTQMHLALWEDVLGMADSGFTSRLAQLRFPGERAVRKKGH